MQGVQCTVARKGRKLSILTMRYHYFPRAGRRRQSASILTMRCHYFPRAGRRRKNAILTTFHYFPRAVQGRRRERDARRATRRARRAGEAGCPPSRSKYLHCLTYSVCLVFRLSAAANRVRGAASATANHGAVSAGALSPATSHRRLTVSPALAHDSRRRFARTSMACSAETMLGQIKRVAPCLGPAIEKLAPPLNCCVKTN